MSWHEDRNKLLLALSCVLLSLLAWMANNLYADVSNLKLSLASYSSAADEVNRRLERIENKVDDILSRIGPK